MLTEEWRDVPGYQGLYEVSSEGRVRSLIQLIPSAHASGERRIKKILNPQINKQGRLRVSLCKQGEPTWHQVHRLVLLTFDGAPPFEGAECRHRDNDPTNNHASNLHWGTHTDNMQDKTTHGTQLIGEKQPNARLNDEAVRSIRKSELSTRQLAKLYGVSQVAIHFVKSRKTWKHVED